MSEAPHPESPAGQDTSGPGPGTGAAGPGPAQAADPGGTAQEAGPKATPPATDRSGTVPATGQNPAARREPPPPLEANDRLVTAVFTAGWAVALIVLLAVRTAIPQHERWWIWVAVAGLAMGLFALWYVPHLQRSRAATAERRAAARKSGSSP